MKGFFRNFTGAVYNFDTSAFKSQKIVTDITRSIQFNDIGNVVRYDKYYIGNGETPDNLAYKLYGDSTKHWILYLLNPNLKGSWPCSDAELERLIENKYGEYSFLALADESVYNIDFKSAASVTFYLEEDGDELDIILHQFDYSRRAFIISQKQNDTEWMNGLETIYVKLSDESGDQIGQKIQLAVNPDNCRYLMKNAAHSYANKTYRDALENNDSATTALSFEEYEYNRNEKQKFIRVLNKVDATRVADQYFEILRDV